MNRKTAILCALAGFSSTLFATNPVAVWDGDFTATQSGYTLNLNGNKLSDDNSTITITNDYAGIDINFGSDHKAGGVTLLVRYEELVKGSKAKILATQSNDSSYTKDRTGVDLQNGSQLWGMWYNGSAWQDWGSKTEAGLLPSSGCYAFTYKPDTGTYLYTGTDTSTISDTAAYGASDLKVSADSLWGVTVGGMRSGSVNANWRAAQNAKITAIAVFNSVLSVSEMNSYNFPSEATIAADTTVSALNTQFGSMSKICLKFSPGVKLTMDTAFAATSVRIISSGSVELSASSQPAAAELAKLDVSEVQGAVKRSWIGPDVIGFNFNSDGYCTTYYYGGAVNTSSALATGTWYANAQSGTSSSNVYADAMTEISWSAVGVWAESTDLWGATFVQAYLDDNGLSPKVSVKAIPFDKYDVIIYCSAETEGKPFHAKYVNGSYYTWDAESGTTVVGNASWGSAKTSATPIYGTNAIRVNDLTGPLSIEGGAGSDSAGGCISAIQIIPADVVIDATSGFTPDATRLANIRKDYRDVTLVGDGANGATIDFGSTTATISSHIVFDGGTHTVTYNNSGTSNITFADNASKPVFETFNGATVNLYSIDLSGWQGSAAAKVPRSNILVRDGTAFNFQPNAGRTFYYQGRFTVEPGAVLTTYYTHADNVFRMNGGAVEGCEQIFVPASDAQSPGTATINGCEGNTGLNLPSDVTPGLGIYVGENSALAMNIAISGVAGAPLGKWGEGTLNLNGSMSGYSGTLSVHEGRVNVTTATTLASVVNDEGATLAYSYAAKPTITSYSGFGTIEVDVSSLVVGGVVESGTYQIAPSGAPAGCVVVSGLPEGSGFSVVSTEDNGVVLTDQAVFSPEWSGPSSTWTSQVYDGRAGYEEAADLLFSQGVAQGASVTVAVDGSKAPASMSFISDSTAYTFAGDGISMTGSLSLSGTAPVVFGTPLSVGGSVSLAAGTSLTVSTNDFTIAAGELSGSGALVLDPGEGVEFTMPGGNASYTGEAVVKSGTVFMGDATAFGPLNKANGIRVKGGAVLSSQNVTSDEGMGYSDSAYKNKAILEEGATLIPWRNNDYKLGAFSALALEGNATVDATDSDTGLSLHYNYNWTHLELGANTLTKIGGRDFYVSAPKITGTGKINVAAGTMTICNSYFASRPGSFVDGTLEVAPAAVLRFISYSGGNAGGGSLTVKNLVLNGAVTRESTTYSTLTVTGYVTGGGETPTLIMGADAKLVPNGSRSLKVSQSLDLSLCGDKLIVDLSGFDFNDDSLMSIPIIRVGNAAMLSADAIWFKYTAEGEPTQEVPKGWKLRTRGSIGYVLTRRGQSMILR